MRRALLLAKTLGLLAAVVVIGCAELQQPAGLELKPLTAAADSVMLEVFLVRMPAEAASDNAAIWAEIDEMSLPAETRQRLKARGFRGGVTGGRIPVELERLMEIAEKSNTKGNDTSLVDFQQDSNVSRRILQMRPGKRGEILASQVHEQLPLFEKQGNVVEGKSYAQAQCCFVVSGVPQPDGHVRLAVESEIQHGAPRNHMNADEISWVMEMRRDRVKLEDVKLDVDLTPGQLLVLGGADGSEGSVGDYFFRETSSEGDSRRMVLIRLAQSRQAPLFTAAEDE